MGWHFLILHLFILPVLALSYHFLSRWRSHRPSIRRARCSSYSSRRRPPTTSTTASCRYSSSSYSPSGWLRRFLPCRCWCWRTRCSSSNHPRNRVKMVRYQFVSPRYQLDPSNSTKERKNGIFLKSCSLSKKSKGVPLPFLKTLLDSFLCDETNEPNALIQSLSRP